MQDTVNLAHSGDTIILKPGTYNGNIEIIRLNDLSNLKLLSESGNPTDTIIVGQKADKEVIFIDNQSNVTVKGFTIKGAGTGKAGISLFWCRNCTIDNTIFLNDDIGIKIDTSPNNIICKNVVAATNATNTSIGIFTYGSDNYNISENSISNHYVGTYILGSAGGIILKNNITQIGSHGIRLNKADSATLESNVVDTVTMFGIYLSESNKTIVKNNTILNRNNIGNGINLLFSNWSKIVGNRISLSNHAIFMNNSRNNILQDNIVPNNAYGIAIRYSENNTIVNNSAYNDTSGIYLTLNSSKNTITGNRANLNSFNGIELHLGANNNTLQNNEITKNQMNGIYLEEAINNLVANNNVSESGAWGISLGSAASNGIFGNFLRNNLGDSIRLENSRNNNITNNNIISETNNGNGISLLRSNSSLLLNNSVTGTIRGIYVSFSSSNTVDKNTASKTKQGILISLSGNNTISNNLVNGSGEGISLNSSLNNSISGNMLTWNNVGVFLCARSHPNLIYNNYFRNTENAHVDNAGCTWYIKSTKGKNIVNGPSFGGNFWATPEYSGFSETASDKNGDGFADTSYTSRDGNIKDMYPLVTVGLPSANFISNVISGYAPLSVQFTDLSKNVKSREWDFGDGSTSTKQNPTHNYYAAGNYTVKLTVIYKNEISSKTIKIVVTTKPVLPTANYNMNTTKGYTPLSIQFTDLSKNSTSRNWNFGDGEFSTLQNPVHIYSKAGKYTVNLTAINGNGTNSKLSTITALARPVLPVANLTNNVSKGYSPLSVQFSDLSKNATSRKWNFGDGTSSTLQNPVHKYSKAGSYTVSLTASNGNGSASKLAIITVLARSATVTANLSSNFSTGQTIIPFADFSTNVTNGYAPLCVLFSDQSQNSISKSWDFNSDGITDSNDASAVYTYTSPGTYTANLTVSNENGTASKTVTIIALQAANTDTDNSESGGKSGSIGVSESHQRSGGKSEGNVRVIGSSGNFGPPAGSTVANMTVTPSENKTHGSETENGTKKANIEQTPDQEKPATNPTKESLKIPGFEIIYGIISLIAVRLYRKK